VFLAMGRAVSGISSPSLLHKPIQLIVHLEPFSLNTVRRLRHDVKETAVLMTENSTERPVDVRAFSHILKGEPYACSS
jgi:hypothetical protein